MNLSSFFEDVYKHQFREKIENEYKQKIYSEYKEYQQTQFPFHEDIILHKLKNKKNT